MEVFVKGVPEDYTDDHLRSLFAPRLLVFGVYHFTCKKLFSKTYATLLIADYKAASAFLNRHGRVGGSSRIADPIRIPFGRMVICQQSQNPPDATDLKRLRAKISGEGQHGISKKGPKKNPSRSRYDVLRLDCGVWDYDNSGLCFHSCYRDRRRGTIVFGRQAAAVILDDPVTPQKTTRLLVKYHTVAQVIAGTGSSPSVTFTLSEPPRLYETNPGSPEPVKDLISGRTLPPSGGTSRVCYLNEQHAAAAGSCLVYRANFSSSNDPHEIMKRLRSTPGAPAIVFQNAPTRSTLRDFGCEMRNFSSSLAVSNLPFKVQFQLLMLARNGIVLPAKLSQMVPTIAALDRVRKTVALAEAIRSLGRSLPFPGPTTKSDYEIDSLISHVSNQSQSFVFRGSMYETARKHEHVAVTYKIFVTPCGTFLEGPDLEVKNRVLRKYPGQEEMFIRVAYVDEDGERIAYEPKVDRSPVIWHKFKGVLDRGVDVAGRSYQFLGFSHSSLRTQQCWMMAPFYQDELKIPSKVISDLGDFSLFQSPSKCAARIGQAFSDATDYVALEPGVVQTIKDIERNGRNFTDGVGMASKEVFRKVWRRFSRSNKRHATILQIRFQGSKGLLALNPALTGEKVFTRDSMNKFKGSERDVNLEICGAGYNAIPMFLNKSLISILEARGADPNAMLELQATAVKRLTDITDSPLNAAIYLETNHFATSPRLPLLIRFLDDIGLDYRNDRFLSRCLEITTLVQLRDLKHRGRIPVPSASTLLGTVDETGFLTPSQVIVATKGEYNFTQWHKGRVAVTRSPALHPGDIQMRDAVAPPDGSPLCKLFNCVIFSQNGERDLASQLSGGDLDGDLYNVIYDERLFPRWESEPADYPRVSARSIGRTVQPTDMSNFFLEFMETDRLGYISNLHMQASDQISTRVRMQIQNGEGSVVVKGGGKLPLLESGESGVYSSDSIKLAEMASTAVDFSKSGVPVDMEDINKLKNFKRNLKPDFMANAPNVIINSSARIGLLEGDEEEERTPDPLTDTLNPGWRATSYYESPMVLGMLYRAVDESKFLKHIQSQNDASHARGKPLLDILERYVETQTHGIQWHHHWEFAKQIQQSYETKIVNNMWQYTPHHQQPLLEYEVFCGAILGRTGGIPSKRARESSMDMRDAFSRDVSEIIEQILEGDDDGAEDGYEEREEAEDDLSLYMNNLNLGGHSGADNIAEKSERLARALACFHASLRLGQSWGSAGPIRSFPYVAAALLLKELEAFHGGRLARVDDRWLPS